MSEHSEVQDVARLLELAARYGLEELEVEEGGLKVTLAAQPATGDEGSSGRTYLWSPPEWNEPAAAPGRSESAHALAAPLTGTFYRAESPDVPPFVEVGATVEQGQTVGLIEAMKVFSNVEADLGGTVVEVLARNGALVHHGDVILYIEPDAAPR